MRNASWQYPVVAVLCAGAALACGNDGPTGGGGPAKLGISTVGNPTARTAFATPVTVQVQDASGGLVSSATNSVTLAFGSNPGVLVWHASGRQGGEILEPVDPVAAAVLTGPTVTFNDEISGMTYDASSGLLLGGNIDAELVSIDPASGTQTLIGTASATDYLTGLAFELGATPRLLGAMNITPDLFSVDVSTGVATSLGPITLTGETINGATGLATDPSTGTVYAVLRLASNTGRNRTLVTIDATTLVATPIGILDQDGMADIAFHPNGTLLGVTGDGATNPDELRSIDKTDATSTLLVTLGNGNDGEAIAVVPAQLSGTLTVAAVDGVATFSGLMINAAANGYTLTATAAGLTSVTSAPFNVVP